MTNSRYERYAYALGLVLALCAAPSSANLPSFDYLKKDLYDAEQSRLHDSPLDFEAPKVIAEPQPAELPVPAPWPRRRPVLPWTVSHDNPEASWARLEQTGAVERHSWPGEVTIRCSEKPCPPQKLVSEAPNPGTWRLATGLAKHSLPIGRPTTF